jgi:hypothetical protein
MKNKELKGERGEEIKGNKQRQSLPWLNTTF